jgi:hypothetical protein
MLGCALVIAELINNVCDNLICVASEYRRFCLVAYAVFYCKKSVLAIIRAQGTLYPYMMEGYTYFSIKKFLQEKAVEVHQAKKKKKSRGKPKP